MGSPPPKTLSNSTSSILEPISSRGATYRVRLAFKTRVAFAHLSRSLSMLCTPSEGLEQLLEEGFLFPYKGSLGGSFLSAEDSVVLFE